MIILIVFALVRAIKKPRALAKVPGFAIAFFGNTMERIVDGILYESKPANFVKLKAYLTKTGHQEFVAHRPLVWSEVCKIDYSVSEPEPRTDEDELSRSARNAARAASRAKTRVRHACKEIGADTLLTLTYRSNQTDLALAKVHLKEFARRMYRVIPGWVAVAGFELQNRGAVHVHLATQRLAPSFVRVDKGAVVRVKSYELIRRIWRSVTKEHGGNIDVKARKRGSSRSVARIASYISKYFTKAFSDGEKWSNRWTKFGSIPSTPRVDLGTFPTMFDCIQECFRLCDQNLSIVTTYSRRDDSFVFMLEPPR
ncbi:MAG: hypothetical protein EAZ24_08235 [Burkholderiales bacterium]|nr:MAG: hypothetical protein EAZ24_08235 [Burkholderiales bacterium]